MKSQWSQQENSQKLFTHLGSSTWYVRKIFWKTNISYPVYARTWAYQGVRSVSFSKNFAYVLNRWLPWSTSKAHIRFRNVFMKPLEVLERINIIISKSYVTNVFQSFSKCFLVRNNGFDYVWLVLWVLKEWNKWWSDNFFILVEFKWSYDLNPTTNVVYEVLVVILTFHVRSV